MAKHDKNKEPPLRSGNTSPQPSNSGGIRKMTSETISPPHDPDKYHPDEIVLYGIPINTGKDKTAKLRLGRRGKRFLILKVITGRDNESELDDDDHNQNQSEDEDEAESRSYKSVISVIYSYSFEGGCYRLQVPKIMTFRAKRTENAKGCGYESDSSFKMWRIDKQQNVFELDTKFDTAETLILEANLPGNRSPNTYGNSMQLAHRNNRLNRDGGSW